MNLNNFGFPELGSRKFWFRKLREVCRKNFHQVAPLKSFMVTGYDNLGASCIMKKNDRFGDRLGVILGQFWVVFGPIWG